MEKLAVFKGNKRELDIFLGQDTLISQDDLTDIEENDLSPMMRLCQLHDRLTDDNFPLQARNVLLAIKSHHHQLGKKLDALLYAK